MNILVRPTSILIEDQRILILRQNVENRKWSLPGGALEARETIEQCLVREMKEETGLETRVRELLYICDRYRGADTHVVHMSFLVERTGKSPPTRRWNHDDPHPSSSSKKVREIKMIPIEELTDFGFSSKFQKLVKENFPERGSYQGDYYDFYGELPPNE